MQALVTGASGFVGNALCRALLAAGHSVVGLTRDPSAAAARLGRECTWVRGGVGFPEQIAEAARDCDVIFHAAGVRVSDAPLRVLRWVHVAGTENVLRAARFSGVERVVHLSCADVSLYDGDRMHWDEQRVLPHAPLGAHAKTKLMAEELALAQSDDDVEVTALRPALVWGEGDVDGLAELVRDTRTGALLFGGGRNIIATTHIDNLTKAALLAAEAPEAEARAYYVTDGEFLEAREFYGQLAQALGLPPPRTHGNLGFAMARARLQDLFARRRGSRRASLVRRGRSALFDVSRARRDLGYEAHIDMPAAMASLRSWVEAQGGLDALLARARPRPEERDVDEQVRAAGGD